MWLFTFHTKSSRAGLLYEGYSSSLVQIGQLHLLSILVPFKSKPVPSPNILVGFLVFVFRFRNLFPWESLQRNWSLTCLCKSVHQLTFTEMKIVFRKWKWISIHYFCISSNMTALKHHHQGWVQHIVEAPPIIVANQWGGHWPSSLPCSWSHQVIITIIMVIIIITIVIPQHQHHHHHHELTDIFPPQDPWHEKREVGIWKILGDDGKAYMLLHIFQIILLSQ